MNILITGGCGFVGSNLALKFKKNYPHYNIIVFDNLKRRGSELNISLLKSHNIEFIHGDIRNEEDFELLDELDIIIDSSAEPSVLAGIAGGQKQLININLVGTLNILNLCIAKKAKFIFLSTSRVYPIIKLNEILVIEGSTRFEIDIQQDLSGITEAGISEMFPLQGYRSLYGASKLASELIIEEYNHFYQLESVINRCGVIAGPRQMGKVDQGVTVLWVARHFWKKDLAYFGYGGTGKQVRDVLHIDDLYDLIDSQINNFNLYNNKILNIGGGLDSSFSLLELTDICKEVTGNSIKIESVKEDRNADIRLYVTDNAQINKLSGWKPKKNTTKIVEDIFIWLKENEEQLKSILN